jgi:hypothetical protein
LLRRRALIDSVLMIIVSVPSFLLIDGMPVSFPWIEECRLQKVCHRCKTFTIADILQCMKTCTTCKESKDESNFGPHKRNKDGLREACRPCRSITYKRWYFTRGGKTKRQECIARNEEYMESFLRNSHCFDCKEDRWEVLEFDHVRGEKKGSVSRMVHNGQSLKTIQEEMAKCEVRCANCHRLKTYRDGGFRGITW